MDEKKNNCEVKERKKSKKKERKIVENDEREINSKNE